MVREAVVKPVGVFGVDAAVGGGALDASVDDVEVEVVGDVGEWTVAGGGEGDGECAGCGGHGVTFKGVGHSLGSDV